MKKVLFAVCLIGCLALAGCPSPVSNDEHPGGSIYAEECWGEWLRVGEDEAWYISGGAIKINGSVSSRSVSLSKQSDRVIQVTEGGSDYYLYASRIANTSFTGKIAGFDDVSPSVQRAVAGGKGWMRVVVEDLDNGSRKTTQTDGDGNFEIQDVIPGDEYRITPEGGTPVRAISKGDGDDIGTITITDGANFKTSGPGETFLMDRQHDITLKITNVGTEDCAAATYRLEFEDGLISSASTAEQEMGPLASGGTKTIEVPLRYDSTEERYADKKINITITDPARNKTWKDSVSLRFYNSRWDISFSVHADSSVSGIIISPEYQTHRFSGRDASVSLPWSPGGYLVVFSGASGDTGTAYSFGVYGTTDYNLEGFTDYGKYEPNDTERTAAEVTAIGVVSYLDTNDIDYYRCNISAPNTDDPASPGSDEDEPDVPDNVSLDESLGRLSENAESGSVYTITLRGDETIGPKTLSYGGKTVGIRISGGGAERTVSLNSSGALFTVGSGVTLVLDDNITLRGRWGNNGALVRVNDGGALVMNAGSKITGNTNTAYSSYGGGVYVAGNGAFTMNGGEISGNTASSYRDYSSYGGGVYVAGNGTFTMNGGEISGNTANTNSSGGGVYVAGNGTFTMNGGEISGNTANTNSSTNSSTNPSNSHSSYGGGVWVGNGTFTMNGGEISGNTASSYGYHYDYSSYGGGVWVGNGTFTMNGGEISGNTASSYRYNYSYGGEGYVSNLYCYSYGGGVYVSSGTFTMSDGEISGNTSSSFSSCGGGVHVADDGTFTMSGGEISGNTASYGGGVYVGNGTFTMNGGEISGNTAYGGGVYVADGSFTKQSGGTIYGSDYYPLGNTASHDDDGHAVYVRDGSKKRNATAGVGVTLDSTMSGTAGGWE